jgi:hypothetical protein
MLADKRCAKLAFAGHWLDFVASAAIASRGCLDALHTEFIAIVIHAACQPPPSFIDRWLIMATSQFRGNICNCQSLRLLLLVLLLGVQQTASFQMDGS